MSDKIILIGKKKHFYKGNMHCHTTLSDGKLSPYEMKEAYKKQGYSFVAITDHESFNNNSYLDDDEFITITSAEYAIKQFPEQSTMKNFNMKVCHLNFYALKQDNDYSFRYSSTLDHFSDPQRHKKLCEKYGTHERPYSAEGINALIKEGKDNGFFVCYNHPRWSLENYADYSGYEGLWAVEIYNSNVNSEGIYEYDPNILDDFLRDGKRIFASCGDDNHNRHGMIDSFHAFVMVEADSLTYDNIINGLLNGDFYISNKPLIYEMYVQDNIVHVKCSDAKRISYSTRGRRSGCIHAENGKTINEAEFQIKETDEYFRIDILDENGNHANTQAYFLSDLI